MYSYAEGGDVEHEMCAGVRGFYRDRPSGSIPDYHSDFCVGHSEGVIDIIGGIA